MGDLGHRDRRSSRSGTRDELQRPIVVDDTLYVQRGEDDYSLLQLDPETFEPIGPPLVGPLDSVVGIVGDGKGELVAVTGWDGITRSSTPPRALSSAAR